MQERLEARGFRNLATWQRAVDTALFHPARREADGGVYAGLPRPIFVNVGRVSVEKNLEAFLSLDLPGSKVIVGDGPARAELAARHPDVRFTGYQSGEALARHYAAPGTKLALTGRDGERLAAVAAACRSAGAAVETATIDVTDRDGLRRWIEKVDDAAPLDLVIANAVIGQGREDEAAARRVFATNVEGVLNTVFPERPRGYQRHEPVFAQ